MKISQILNLLLAAALVILSIKLVMDNKSAIVTDGDSNGTDAVIENIMTRTSIRDYQDKPVEDAKIEAMLKAAMAAPSAGNKQPWRFVVIKDKNTIKAISENFHTMKMAEKAPVAIVVCGDLNATFPGDGVDYWIQDASAATENLLLAAHSMGLGAVWCGIYPMKERVSLLKDMLELPDDIVPLNVVPVGYPAQDPAPKDKWKPDYIRYESWNGTTPTIKIAEAKAKEWKEVAPTAFRENPFNIFSGALSLSVGTKDKMNAMTIGWGGLGVLWGRDRPVVTVYVRKDRFTHQFMEDNDYFVVEGFSQDYDKQLKYLGSVSGRDEDKMKGVGLTVKYTQQGTPYFEEGDLMFVCKKIYGAPFNPDGFGDIPGDYYKDKPLHSMYIGEIERIMIKQ